MKKFLLLTVILMAAATLVSAAPCPTNTTLDAWVLLGAGGCTSQGLKFSNFTFSSANSLSSSSVAVLLQSGAGGNGQFFDNLIFTRTGGTGTFTGGFTLNYDVTIVPGNPLNIVSIIMSKDQINTNFLPNGVDSQDFQTPGVTPSPIEVSGCTTPGNPACVETKQSNPYFLTGLHTWTTVTVPDGNNVLSYEQDFTSAVPEPVTFLLIGSGLIGLTFLRRRLTKG